MNLDYNTLQHLENHPVVIPGIPVMYIRDEGGIALLKKGLTKMQVFKIIDEKATAVPLEAKAFCKAMRARAENEEKNKDFVKDLTGD